MRLRAIFVVISSLAVGCALCAQQPRTNNVASDKQLAASIRELIVVTNGRQLAEQILNQLFPSLEALAPSVPKDVWEQLRAGIHTDELIELIVPIYAKYYSKEDIEGLIKFYQSPLGQKLIANQSAIVRDSQAAGQEYAKEVVGRVISQLKEKGYSIALPPKA